MADHDHKLQSAGGRISKNGTLDRELDAALAKYAVVEPRAGLEERVLASLRAEREQYAAPAWRAWATMAVLSAVVVVVAVLLAWRFEKPTDTTAHRPPISTPGGRQAGTQVANSGQPTGDHPAVPAPQRRPTRGVSHPGVRHPQTNNAAGPRLEQFPSPLPLSEQEKILASYVAEYPEHAALVAQARTEALRRDNEEEVGTADTGSMR